MKNKQLIITIIFILGLGLGVIVLALMEIDQPNHSTIDSSRRQDLFVIDLGLEIFYKKNGFFPGTNNTPECIKSGDKGVGDSIKHIYEPGGSAPIDPAPDPNTWLCNGNKSGRYWYSALSKDDIKNQAFILCADMDSFQKANTDVGEGKVGDIANAPASNNSAATLMTTNYRELTTKVGAITSSSKLTKELPDAGQSQYCILKP
jgi:hypothetical protein